MPRDCGGLRCVDSVASSPPAWVSRSRQGLSRKPAPSPAPSSPSSGARPPSPDSDVALAPPPWTWDPDVPSSASTPRPVPRGRYPYNRSSRGRARETAISGPTLALPHAYPPISALLGQSERFATWPDLTNRSASPYRRVQAPGRDRRRKRGAQRPSAARLPGHSQALEVALARAVSHATVARSAGDVRGTDQVCWQGKRARAGGSHGRARQPAVPRSSTCRATAARATASAAAGRAAGPGAPASIAPT